MYYNAPYDSILLWYFYYLLVTIWASLSEQKIFPLSSSSQNQVLKLSHEPFSHGEPGSV
tara:strand:+ start:2648 stop:2824 length:177 start_codon:yes stop_codon:yes gene_type:complete